MSNRIIHDSAARLKGSRLKMHADQGKISHLHAFVYWLQGNEMREEVEPDKWEVHVNQDSQFCKSSVQTCVPSKSVI